MIIRKHRRKIISTLVAFVLLLSCIPVANADGYIEGTACQFPRGTTLGYITSPTGKQEIVVGRIVQTSRPQAYSTGSNAAGITYECDLYTDGYSLQAIQKNNQITGHDAYNCSTVRLTIYFYENSNVNPAQYLLYNVSGGWTLSVDGISAVGTLTYGCSGPNDGGITQADTVSVGSNFSKNTYFTDYVENSYISVMGANLTVNYRMLDGSTWSYTLTNNYFNSPLM